jgi:hypothetical protein
MTHEALSQLNISSKVRGQAIWGGSRRLLRYSLKHAAGFEDKGWQNDSTQISTRAKLGNNVHEYCISRLEGLVYIDRGKRFIRRLTIALLGLDYERVIFDYCFVYPRRLIH